jgi:hypothetical protein
MDLMRKEMDANVKAELRVSGHGVAFLDGIERRGCRFYFSRDML